MKLKKCLVLLLSLCLAIALCACGAKEDDTRGADGAQSNTTSDSQQTPSGDTGSSVNFGLQSAPDPDFDSPATGDDSGKLYTIVGDYAYELDPNTLQPTGDPLDPVTHLPVSNPVLEGENPSTPNNPQNQPQEPAAPADTQPDPEPVATAEPDPEPVATQEKLPNTGMFLEDD